MARDVSELTRSERAQRDPSLRAFLDAEIPRAGIELDTLRSQLGITTQRLAALSAQIDAAHKTNTALRRRLGRGGRPLPNVDGTRDAE